MRRFKSYVRIDDDDHGHSTAKQIARQWKVLNGERERSFAPYITATHRQILGANLHSIDSFPSTTSFSCCPSAVPAMQLIMRNSLSSANIVTVNYLISERWKYVFSLTRTSCARNWHRKKKCTDVEAPLLMHCHESNDVNAIIVACFSSCCWRYSANEQSIGLQNLVSGFREFAAVNVVSVYLFNIWCLCRGRRQRRCQFVTHDKSTAIKAKSTNTSPSAVTHTHTQPSTSAHQRRNVCGWFATNIAQSIAYLRRCNENPLRQCRR